MSFPTTILDLIVELALGADLTADPSTWVWTAAPPAGQPGCVRAEGGIVITRGGRDGVAKPPPSTCMFTVDGTDGRWVPTNPLGIWYGQLKLNTPIRVRTNETASSVRWTGFLSSLPPRWRGGEADAVVHITASGILQRLQRGTTPLRSPLVRAISKPISAPAPVAYWPGEDASAATSLAEFFGGTPMKLTGQVVTLASDGPPGSLPLPEFTTVGGAIGTIPTYVPSGSWTAMCVLNFPASPASSTVLMRWYTTGTYPLWQITLSPGSPDALALEAYDTAGTIQINHPLNFAVGTVSEPFGQWVILAANVTPNGSNLDYSYDIYQSFGGSGSSTGSAAGVTAGAISTLRAHANSKFNGALAGHWAAWNADVNIALDTNILSALDAHIGDDVVGRVIGLGDEEGIPVEWDSGSSITMGPQGTDSFLNLLREAEAVSGGRLFENRDPTQFNAYLHLLHAGDLENQAAALVLDRDASELFEPFEPTDDDQELRNDWTVTRQTLAGTGSSARVIATEGEHGRLTPANAGMHNDSVPVNVETDEQLVHQAGWRVNVGTVEGLRFPVVTLYLDAKPSLIPSWLNCEIGSRVTITHPPAGLPPDPIDLMIEGWVETLDAISWTVQLFCSPYQPWHVFQLAEDVGDTDPFLGRLDGDEKCALRAALTSTAMGATDFDPNFYRWTEAADDFPLNITIKPRGAPGKGEVVTLSGISTSAAIFLSAGTPTHGSNASVTPGFPTSTTTGDNLFVLAAIRNSGTGTVDTPTGYTRLPVFDETANVGLFTKVDGGSEVAPLVSFTGGVANATTSAVMFAWRNLPISLADLADMVVDSVNQLNASAQNIAYGGVYVPTLAGLVQLVIGWKQDDYTSVAVPTGFTEMFEASSGTGDDQSLYCAYRIDTTPAVVVDGSLAVTGGASAISRSAVVALAGGIQAMTISARSVNGVPKAHSAGALIEVDDPAVLAL